MCRLLGLQPTGVKQKSLQGFTADGQLQLGFCMGKEQQQVFEGFIGFITAKGTGENTRSLPEGLFHQLGGFAGQGGILE